MDVCTIIAQNYLAHARVLADSYSKFHPGKRLIVVLIDDREHECLAEEPFEKFWIQDILTDQRMLHDMAIRYTIVELSTAVKPFVLSWLRNRSGGVAIYLDPDVQLFSSLADVEPLALRHGIVLTPHVVTPMTRDGMRPAERYTPGRSLQSRVHSRGPRKRRDAQLVGRENQNRCIDRPGRWDVHRSTLD